MSSLLQDNAAKLEKLNKNAEKTLLDTLAALGGAQFQEEDIIFEGRKMILPATMTIRGAIKALQRKLEQDEEITNFSHVFNYRPWDGAAALVTGLRKHFGTTGIAQATRTMFGNIPPSLRDIPTGVGETVQVPWGEVAFPTLEATLYLQETYDREKGKLFQLSVAAPRKYRDHVSGLFKVIEQELREHSIYKGKVINGAEMPGFIDPYVVDKNKVVYTDVVQDQLEANIWSLPKYAEVQKRLGLPLKRSVLLAGPYGTGKSLAAMLTAQVATENNWTFIQCRPGDNLQEVQQTALLYQPAIVFYEDVDTLASSGDPEKIQSLLDAFDGITAKNTELIMVLTTNHVDKIHKGMIRPGRLDAIVMIEALDSKGIQSLIQATVDARFLDKNIDYDLVEKAMHGFLPAFIKEAIDRTQRYAVSRTQGEPQTLTTDDFVNAAIGLRFQLDLMEKAGEGEKTPDIHTAMKNLTRLAATEVFEGRQVRIERGGGDWATVVVDEERGKAELTDLGR